MQHDPKRFRLDSRHAARPLDIDAPHPNPTRHSTPRQGGQIERQTTTRAIVTTSPLRRRFLSGSHAAPLQLQAGMGSKAFTVSCTNCLKDLSTTFVDNRPTPNSKRVHIDPAAYPKSLGGFSRAIQIEDPSADLAAAKVGGCRLRAAIEGLGAGRPILMEHWNTFGPALTAAASRPRLRTINPRANVIQRLFRGGSNDWSVSAERSANGSDRSAFSAGARRAAGSMAGMWSAASSM